MSEPWAFYATYVPARALAEPLLVSVVPLTAVANWFIRRRPRAMGLVAMAVPLGSSGLVLWYEFLLAHGGWRVAFMSLAILFWLLLVIPGALALRRRPEDLGLFPDGVRPPSSTAERTPLGRGHGDAGRQSSLEPLSWTLRQATGTSTLWLLAVANGLAGAATGGTAFNLVAYLTDAGLDSAVSAGALSVFAVAGALGSAIWALLAEQLPARLLNVATLVSAACTMALLLQVQAAPLAYLFAALFGFTARGQGVLVQVQLAQYFGRRSYGAISGLTNPFVLGGLGVGPVLAALAFDASGGYAGVFAAFGVVFIVAAALTGLARPPGSPG